MMGEKFTEKEAIQNLADIQRAEAKRLLNQLFYPADTESVALNNAVDCIIAAAVLEIKAAG